MKRKLRQLFCRHKSVSVTRWCIKHIPDYEPSCVVVEYKCSKCGKYLYSYLTGEDKKIWIETMGDYKHENFNCTRQEGNTVKCSECIHCLYCEQGFFKWNECNVTKKKINKIDKERKCEHYESNIIRL